MVPKLVFKSSFVAVMFILLTGACARQTSKLTNRFNDSYYHWVNLPYENSEAGIYQFAMEDSTYSRFTQKVVRVWEGNAYNVGRVTCYKLLLNGEQFGALRGDKIVIVRNSDHKIAHIYIDTLVMMEGKIGSKVFIISGYDTCRSGSNFYLFRLGKDSIHLLHETEMLVCKWNEDCIVYKNKFLNRHIEDRNGDGWNDLWFEGWKYKYCKGYSTEPELYPFDSLYIQSMSLSNIKGKSPLWEEVILAE